MFFVSVLSFQQQDTVLHLKFKKTWMDTFNCFELFVFTHWHNSEEASSVCTLFISLGCFSVDQNNLITISISKRSIYFYELHREASISQNIILLHPIYVSNVSFLLTKKINQFILNWNNSFIYNKHNYGLLYHLFVVVVFKHNCIFVEIEGLILHPKRNRNLHYSSNWT